jgi:hypothetical protein
MIQRLVPRRGLSLLIGLTALLGYLIYRSANPYCISLEAVVVPLLIAESLQQGDRVGRIVLWLVTSLLPTRARAEWREDFASALAEREDGRGPIDVSLDIALGMPVIVWREWGSALPSVTLVDDTLEVSWRRALRLWGLWCLLAAPLLWVLHADLNVWLFASLGGILSACLLAAPRRSRQADRRRVVLTFAFNLAFSIDPWPSISATATAVTLVAAGGVLAVKPTTRPAVLAVGLLTATEVAIPGLTVAAWQAAAVMVIACISAVTIALWIRMIMVMSYGWIDSLPRSLVSGALMTVVSTLGIATAMPSEFRPLQLLQLLLVSCLAGAVAHGLITVLLHRAVGLIEVLAPRSVAR